MSYYTDTIRSLKSAGFVEHAKDYQYLRSKYYQRGTQIKKLERELNEARGCLLEAMFAGTADPKGYEKYYDDDVWSRWRKAAGLEEQ